LGGSKRIVMLGDMVGMLADKAVIVAAKWLIALCHRASVYQVKGWIGYVSFGGCQGSECDNCVWV